MPTDASSSVLTANTAANVLVSRVGATLSASQSRSGRTGIVKSFAVWSDCSLPETRDPLWQLRLPCSSRHSLCSLFS